MQFIRGTHNIRPEHRFCVATIGNFDGIHLGHTAILKALSQKGDELGKPVCVILFEPQPREYIQGEQSPPRITGLREKLALLQAVGVDQVLCLPFNETLQNLTPDDFVMNILVKGLAICYLMVGDDFCYGLGRAGNLAHLHKMSDRHGFEICDTTTISVGKQRVSSTRIRELLMKGDLSGAEKLLGRPFMLMGRVIKGQQLGRRLGFPTANIRMRHHKLPLEGVYAVRVWINEYCYQGVANLGSRPTINTFSPLLEVHLMDFTDNLYGKTLKVEFLHKIRDAKKFDSLSALQLAIANDIKSGRELFSRCLSCV